MHETRIGIRQVLTSMLILSTCLLRSASKRQELISQRRAMNIFVRGGEDCGYTYKAFLAVGSNMGNRFENIQQALHLLCNEEGQDIQQTKIVRTSFLRETYPMYITEQPHFLNGAVQVETNLKPSDMLKKIKSIESQLGRNFKTVRNGPRPVDVDILFYDTVEEGSRCAPVIVKHRDLSVPHASIQEREFVLEPLIDIVGRDFHHPTLNNTLGQLLDSTREELPKLSRDRPSSRVLPLPRDRLIYFNRTVIMGILNVTPDSFSDGGRWSASDIAIQHGLDLVAQGADIIDVGGESTRPGAKEIDVSEELERVIPVIKGLRRLSDIPISIDTRHAKVAEAAILAGADIVNDVSGGLFDANMIEVVSRLGVPMIFMHMRGTPETMQSMVEYDDIVDTVVGVLSERSGVAEQAGLHRWLQVVDPGIGFAKDLHGNLSLLKNLAALRIGTRNLPVLLGPSRKGFIGKLTDATQPADRDPGTIAACVASLCLDQSADHDGGSLIRVHNVLASKQAMSVMDAIRRS